MTLLVANHVDDVRGIGCIEDREAFRQSQRGGVAPERPVGDRMECSSDHPPRRRGRAAVKAGETQERRRPRQHLPGRPAGEREQEKAFGGRPGGEQPGDPSRERGGLPGSGTGENPQRPTFMGDGTSLRHRQVIQPLEHLFDDTAVRLEARYFVSRVAMTLIVVATTTTPKRYDSSACRSAAIRIGFAPMSVSETWNVMPMVSAI